MTAADSVGLMAQAVSRGPVSGTAVKPTRRKPFLVDLYSTAVGKKYVMAVTGLIGIGFVIGHMIGNLKMYIGTISEGGERATTSTSTASSSASCSCRSCPARTSSGVFGSCSSARCCCTSTPRTP
ncbi:MAG: hypothetical protein WKF58_08705 [Ilumatobacteraceae bacterium]